jgi:hypothetical protein
MPRKKNPGDTGIDPGTFRLVAQCLNHYATPGYLWRSHNDEIAWRRISQNVSPSLSDARLYIADINILNSNLSRCSIWQKFNAGGVIRPPAQVQEIATSSLNKRTTGKTDPDYSVAYVTTPPGLISSVYALQHVAKLTVQKPELINDLQLTKSRKCGSETAVPPTSTETAATPRLTVRAAFRRTLHISDCTQVGNFPTFDSVQFFLYLTRRKNYQTVFRNVPKKKGLKTSANTKYNIINII